MVLGIEVRDLKEEGMEKEDFSLLLVNFMKENSIKG
jgi:hypothetical protein